jgi:hypothetical protein
LSPATRNPMAQLIKNFCSTLAHFKPFLLYTTAAEGKEF